MLNNKTIETIMRLNQTEKINSSVRFIVDTLLHWLKIEKEHE